MTKLALAILTTVLSQPALASLSAQQVAKTFAHPEIQRVLTYSSIQSIKEGPSYKCAGCFGMYVEAVNTKGVRYLYTLSGWDLHGRFTVDIIETEIL